MKPQRGRGSRKRNANSPTQEPVEVYCRLRPLDDPNEAVCAKPMNEKVVQLVPPDNAVGRNGHVKEYQYTFQNVFDEYSSQKAVFDRTALPLVEDLLSGKSGLLFTYGITGSGKTYTMTGVPNDQGILPRCLDVLFNSIGELQTKKYVFKPDRMNGFEVQSEADAMLERQKKDIMPNLTTPSKTPSKTRSDSNSDNERIIDPTLVDCVDDDSNYAVFVSYIEIYNNYVYDLLDDLPYNPITGFKTPQTKILRTDSSDNMYVHNCTEVEVKQPQDAIDAFYKGQKRRKVAHTTLNAESSRSHSVFNIRLVQAPLDSRGEEVIQQSEEYFDSDKICVSQLSLVDLAGSERTNRTKNSGDRLKEAGNINQSLMVLRTCLEILRENQLNEQSKLVPYRDSRLTHLFKTFFDGDGKVRMIVCVNPKHTEYEETIHVMKFAEMTQEVLVTKAVASNKFDVGFTPGRRRMHQQMEELRVQEEEILPKKPVIDFSYGAPFPVLTLVHPADHMTLRNINGCLEDRIRRRQLMLVDYEQSCIDFRAQLVEFEKDYANLRQRCMELETKSVTKEKEVARLEKANRNQERRLEELSRALKDMEKENQLLGLQVQDKTWKIQVERRAKEHLKNDYRNRLQMNNEAWEKNLEKERQKMELEAENELDERDRKLEMLRDFVNEDCGATRTPRTRTRGPAGLPTPKPRTQTTPASIFAASTPSSQSIEIKPSCNSLMSDKFPPELKKSRSKRNNCGNYSNYDPSLRSENDMSSVGGSTIASSAKAIGRAGNTRVNPRSAVRIPSAKSIPNLSQVGVTPTPSKGRNPVVNPKYHRRSKSSGNAEVWLEHKSSDIIDTNTLMQPKMTKKRSVSKLDMKDTKQSSKYVLTHQEQDSSDELITKLVKGDVVRTPSGGASVVFNEVEALRRVSPGGRKRRSPTGPVYDPELQWTDTEERCSTALEHHKRTRTTNL